MKFRFIGCSKLFILLSHTSPKCCLPTGHFALPRQKLLYLTFTQLKLLIMMTLIIHYNLRPNTYPRRVPFYNEVYTYTWTSIVMVSINYFTCNKIHSVKSNEAKLTLLSQAHHLSISKVIQFSRWDRMTDSLNWKLKYVPTYITENPLPHCRDPSLRESLFQSIALANSAWNFLDEEYFLGNIRVIVMKVYVKVPSLSLNSVSIIWDGWWREFCFTLRAMFSDEKENLQ